MRLTLAFVFVLTASVSGQIEHAPTVAQCQADQRLWMANMQDAAKAHDHSTLHGYEA